MTTTKAKYRERQGDLVIDLGDGGGLVLNKMDGRRYFLEVHREVNKKGKPTGEYYRFARDENNRGIFNFKGPLRKEINSYFPNMEKDMNKNKKIQSIKLEVII